MPDISAESAAFSDADKICLVTESGSQKIIKDRALKLFPAGVRTVLYEVPQSENAKTPEEAVKLCSFLFSKGFSRKSLIIAAGGGTVTDLSGFAASIYMRGIRWISVPTSFLGQIDAGIGGKTAVNLDEGKNVIGTFHQPELTVCDTAFLDSLPHSELRAGAGELAKYAMITPRALRVKLLQALPQALIGDTAALNSCVTLCAGYKLKLVSADEKDEKGIREPLNLGHTAGHAFEAMSGGKMHHGEAVARGLKFIINLSQLCGALKQEEAVRLNAVIDILHLPEMPKGQWQFDKFTSLISRDKKARGAGNRFILLRGAGKTETAVNVKENLLLKAFEATVK